MNIIFLGTSAMVPTKDRNHSGIYLEYRGEGILFDCGEGIQRQLKLAGITPTKIKQICISHWHGDHVLGLPGLLLTLGSCDYTSCLRLYGPTGSKNYLKNMLTGFAEKISIDVEIIEVSTGTIYDGSDYSLECTKLEHSIPCIGFAFHEKDRRRINVSFVRKLGIPDGPLLGKLQNGKSVEWKGKKVDVNEATRIIKGKRIVYIGDTVPCANAQKLAKNADILIAEATHSDEIEDKAEAYGHMTAKQTAMLASESEVKKLIMTHFSQRYKTVDMLLEEAKTIFPKTECAYDFMKVKI